MVSILGGGVPVPSGFQKRPVRLGPRVGNIPVNVMHEDERHGEIETMRCSTKGRKKENKKRLTEWCTDLITS